MHTKIIKSIGPHSNPDNLTTIGYCIESPKDVLIYALNQGYRIGGYRQAGQTRAFGEGLVIRGTDMEPLDFGLDIKGKLEDIPFSEYNLKLDEVTEQNIELMFGNIGKNLHMFRNGKYQSLFQVKQEFLKPQDKLVMSAAREFVETIKGYSVTLNYLTSLSK